MIFQNSTPLVMKDKGPCLLCKVEEWKPETIVLSGVEKSVFECASCGLTFKAKPSEMDHWNRILKRPVLAPPVSTGVHLEPEFVNSKHIVT